jgi:hypothetical protein
MIVSYEVGPTSDHFRPPKRILRSLKFAVNRKLRIFLRILGYSEKGPQLSVRLLSASIPALQKRQAERGQAHLLYRPETW